VLLYLKPTYKLRLQFVAEQSRRGITVATRCVIRHTVRLSVRYTCTGRRLESVTEQAGFFRFNASVQYNKQERWLTQRDRATAVSKVSNKND